MAPENREALTPAEWKIMRIVWRHRSCSARDVYQEAADLHGWAISTVKTLLRRLVEKGHLKTGRVGNSFVYRPSQPALKSLVTAADNLLANVLSGMAGPLLMHLVKKSDLSPDDIAQLRELLDSHDSAKETGDDQH
jgi:BlaI family transcriptional regulator, penicillinase repressor